MARNTNNSTWLLVLAVVIVWLFLSGSSESPDTELARTTREAVQLAHEAQTDSQAATLWTGRFRLLSLIIGVTTPLTIAYFIWSSSSKSHIDTLEVIDFVENHLQPSSRPKAQSESCSAVLPPIAANVSEESIIM